MKRHAPATARNSEAIADVLARELPTKGLVLELASGSGEHAVFFARRFDALEWQPSDTDPEALLSVDAYAEEAALTNLKSAVQIDASASPWSIDRADAVLCINMVHISPWEATQGLFEGAATVLAGGAPLILYGPYFEEGVEAAPSNITFDLSLKSRDPRWGLRQVEALDALAVQTGFERSARYPMPANNLALIYRCL